MNKCCPNNPPKRKKPQGKIDIKKVIKGIIEGKKKKDIAEEAGSIARSDSNKCSAVTRVQNSEEYKDFNKKLIEILKKEIIRLSSNISLKELDRVQYDKAVSSLEKLNKQVQLLSGGATERTEVDIGEVKGFLDNA